MNGASSWLGEAGGPRDQVLQRFGTGRLPVCRASRTPFLALVSLWMRVRPRRDADHGALSPFLLPPVPRDCRHPLPRSSSRRPLDALPSFWIRFVDGNPRFLSPGTRPVFLLNVFCSFLPLCRHGKLTFSFNLLGSLSCFLEHYRPSQVPGWVVSPMFCVLSS